MRIAFLSDIHGNREALTACLDHVARTGVDRIVFLGDYVGYGADPVFVLDTVMDRVAHGALAVRGNHDAGALELDPRMSDAAYISLEWTQTKLGDLHRDFIRALPMTCEEGGRLYVHASAYAPTEWHYVTGLFSASKSLTATQAQATFCGHTHVPMLFHMSMTGKIASVEPVDRVDIPLTARRRWLAAIGSVGQPRDGNPAACYAVLDIKRGVLTYVRVPYDIDTAARKIRDAGLPMELSYRLYEGR